MCVCAACVRVGRGRYCEGGIGKQPKQSGRDEIACYKLG